MILSTFYPAVVISISMTSDDATFTPPRLVDMAELSGLRFNVRLQALK